MTATATKKKRSQAKQPKGSPAVSLDFTPKEMDSITETKGDVVRSKLAEFVKGASLTKLRKMAKSFGITFGPDDIDALLPHWKKAQLLEFAQKSGIEIPKSANTDAIVAMLRAHRDRWVPVKEVQAAEPRV